MKKIIYLYVLETMADWEIGYILQGISMAKNKEYEIRTVGVTKNPIKSLGGMTIVPDCTMDEIEEDRIAALLLPGADIWAAEEQKVILEKAVDYLEKGILVGAICGATLALANCGVLDKRNHTSNSLYYLQGCSAVYSGSEYYKEEKSVRDHNLVTASSVGGLLWARQIMEGLEVYTEEEIESWYQFFLTGGAEYYYEVMKLMA